ncbi:TylF/MycF/NovP-related O-methyltransferase [Rhizobium alvei]|uniref:TylF/MycF/NovP-related O-methyltransferase n=1 Tax=Rhizobium alvei TaxID=1132659 RepID=A0ABT8YM02_9HYPH|nr:TylF/MycF/NovP-related O-methyltransferase [Rhizobium alvei]MDO6964738.1 TylF/MycF/NovP-related O-methyltransferase [Rhizobium alvei]
MNTTNGTFFYPSGGEERYFDRLNEIIQKHPHDIRHYLDLFTVYASRRSFIRQLAHYELFKLTIDLPGHYLDFGVYFGKSYFSWHKFLEVLTPTATHKKVFGFDTFAGFPELAAEDGAEDEAVQKKAGGLNSASFLDEFRLLLDLHNQDSVIPANRGAIIVGDVTQTLPDWLNVNPEARFCLINIDVDIYDPTTAILEHCWERLVPGGVLVLDEYGTSKWPGETRAWDEFAKRSGISAQIKRFPWANAPGGYVVKS